MPRCRFPAVHGAGPTDGKTGEQGEISRRLEIPACHPAKRVEAVLEFENPCGPQAFLILAAHDVSNFTTRGAVVDCSTTLDHLKPRGCKPLLSIMVQTSDRR
jgi:hypothetical protein